METDVLIVGGGPAGLATAIAARRAGFKVLLADHAVPPIDKACGEGIMPDGLSALETVGVKVPCDRAYPFRGIRFLEGSLSVDSLFPCGVGFGLRRTVLHELLTSQARETGVDLRWGARISELSARHAVLGGVSVGFRWMIGADGHASMVRQCMGIGRKKTEKRRFGFRQHFSIAPWTDCVEVYWSNCGQVYVTPVSENEVCVALITSDPHVRLDCIPSQFPLLAKRLAGALPSSRPQGAITATCRLDTVVAGNMALVGEASGSVDAITGEGMSLGFQQAVAVVDAMRAGSLQRYERAHLAINEKAHQMARLMLMLGSRTGLRHRTLRALSSRPDLFAEILSVHVGAVKISDFGVSRALALGWNMLTA